MDMNADAPIWLTALIIAAYSIFEAWLGGTTAIKANSLLALIKNLISAIKQKNNKEI